MIPGSRAWRLRRRIGARSYDHERAPADRPEMRAVRSAIERLYERHADHRLEGFLILSAWTGPGIAQGSAEIECLLSPEFLARSQATSDLMRAMAEEIVSGKGSR